MSICAGRLAALAMAAFVWTSGHAAQAERPSPTLDRLLEAFRGMEGLEATFREEKRIALLAEPLVSEGTLHYARGKLARHTLSPRRQSVLLEGERLRFFDGDREEVVDLGANAALRTFVTSFLRLLAGDRAALERAFDLRFDHEGARWRVVLEPKTDAVRRMVRRIELEGTELILAKMRVVEASGDEARTTFSEVKPNRVYRDEELRRLFRVAR